MSDLRGFGLRGKRGWILQKTLAHLILVGLLFVVFLAAMDAKVGSRGMKQQVLEKELALLIDAADEGFVFEVRRVSDDGIINSVGVEDGRIYIGVDGLGSSGGYPYFSRYDVEVEEDDVKFFVRVG